MGITQTKLQEVKIILDSLKSRMGRRMMIGMRNKRGGKKNETLTEKDFLSNIMIDYMWKNLGEKIVTQIDHIN